MLPKTQFLQGGIILFVRETAIFCFLRDVFSIVNSILRLNLRKFYTYTSSQKFDSISNSILGDVRKM